MYETDAIVLRAIRYGEADSVLTLYTRERGRVSAIAKGTRKSTSRLGGRLQPGVEVHLGLHEGKGEMHTVRQAQVLDAHAGLWVEGYRLRAAGSVLEATMRVLGEQEPNVGAYNLLSRGLSLLSVVTPSAGRPRHDPVVLGVLVKLLVVAGIVPRLARCVSCDSAEPMVAFSAHLGGALCGGCARLGEPVDDAVFAAFAGFVTEPLSEGDGGISGPDASGVERLVGLVLKEHLGVVLRAAPDVG